MKSRRARGDAKARGGPSRFAARWRVLARLASFAQIGELARGLNVQLRVAYGTKGAFHLSELTGRTIQVIMRISLLINTIQLDHSIPKSMHEGDSVSTKTLGKKHFSLSK